MKLGHLVRSGLNRVGYDVHTIQEDSLTFLSHLRSLSRRFEVECIIDVGANVGQFGYEARLIWPKHRLLSFEPNPTPYKALASLAESDPNWSAYQLALGPSDGIISLNISAADDFSSCLPPSDLGKRLWSREIEVKQTVEVPVRRLDDFLRAEQIQARNVLLKLDTQGFDRQVLLGAEEVLRNADIVITECSVQPLYEGAFGLEEALEFLRSRDFTLSGLFPVCRDEDEALVEVNCAFVRKATAGSPTA